MAEKQYIERDAVLAEIEEAFRETDPTAEEQIGLLTGMYSEEELQNLYEKQVEKDKSEIERKETAP